MWKQQVLLCNGTWEDTGETADEDDQMIPDRFATKEAAEADLKLWLDDLIEQGVDDSYDDYRVVQVTYNHAFDLAFSVVTCNEWEDVTAEELLEALEARVRYLRNHPEEIAESCGYYDDSYEMED